MPGAVAYGCHEGSRSEYLAQYVFGSWGTAVAIPHQEDHGIDLTCTLMERVGNRYLAKSPYTVQVKSSMEKVIFDGRESVRWLIEHPLPLFVCVVDKPFARLSIYHTLPRFHAWSLGQWPDRIEMTPVPATPGKKGRCDKWPGSYSFSLEPPILDFTVNDILDNSFWQNARQVFDWWVNIENDNLARVRAKLLKCRMPDGYRTNEISHCGWVELSLVYPTEEQFNLTTCRLKESLAWVGEQLLRREDCVGAAAAALLHHHLFPDERGFPLTRVQTALNQRLGRTGYLYAGVDHLEQVIQATLGNEKWSGLEYERKGERKEARDS
jgi:hypothetical protein